MENKQVFQLADELKACKEQKKELEAQTKTLTDEIERLDLALSDAMAETECERFTRNGNTFYLNTRLYASPVSGKKDVQLGPHRYNILSVINFEERNIYLQLLCSEKVGEEDD